MTIHTAGNTAHTAPSYHWTPALQRAFLAHLATEGSVQRAAWHVSMSPRAAYDLRYRDEGMAFRMGWAAAILIARDVLEDAVMERALHGGDEAYTRSAPDADGTVHIHRTRTDNRLGMACLSRLDRMHDQANMNTDERAMAKTITRGWGVFLDLIGADEAEIGANNGIIARHLVAAMQRRNPFAAVWSDGEFEREVAQITDDVADADAAQTSDETAQAEAPLTPEQEAADMEVWFSSDAQEWRTTFPPAQDFDGEEEGVFGDSDYERSLCDDEMTVMRTMIDASTAPLRAAGEAARQKWFGMAA
jgi:hypothetical protein